MKLLLAKLLWLNPLLVMADDNDDDADDDGDYAEGGK